MIRTEPSTCSIRLVLWAVILIGCTHWENASHRGFRHTEVRGEVRSSRRILRLALGLYHECAILDGGTVACRGSNTFGELGTGDLLPQYGGVIRPVMALRNVAEVIAGPGAVSCARTHDGNVFCWGIMESNFVLPTNSSPSRTPVRGQTAPVRISNLHSATSLAISTHGACATTSLGGLFCWGNVRFPTLTMESQIGSLVEFSGCNDASSLLAFSGGMIARCSGMSHFSSQFSYVPPIAVDTQVRTSAVGDARICSWQRDGRRVDCWGDIGSLSGPDNQLAVTHQFVREVDDVAVGPFHACALSRGEVYCWGTNAHGESGQSASSSGRCVYAGSPRPCVPSPRRVEGISTAMGIAVGGSRSCAVLQNSSAVCWGALSGYDTATPHHMDWGTTLAR